MQDYSKRKYKKKYYKSKKMPVLYIPIKPKTEADKIRQEGKF